MICRYCFLFVSILFSLALSSQSGRLSFYPALDAAHCGVLVQDVSSGTILEAYQSDRSFVPASVMKLITTSYALSQKSSDFVFETQLLMKGTLVDGVLHGDLIINGSGDPTLGSHYFSNVPDAFMAQWYVKLQEMGVKQIQGSIIADASVFDQRPIPDKWIWEDIGNYYGAGCYGLAYRDNMYVINYAQASVGDLVDIESIHPSIPHLEIASHVTAANNNRDNAYIYGGPWSFDKQVYGTIPANRSLFSIKGAMPNPPFVLASAFKDYLQSEGITIAAPPEVGWVSVGVECDTIDSWYSPSLIDIISVTNKQSNNLFAEHLLKFMAINDSEPASMQLAISQMLDFWNEKGVSVDGVKCYDGSGLSRANLLTPDFIVGVLRYMITHADADDYLSTLATSGVDGTFKYFLDDTALQGKLMGKSGSMSGVKCYAGVVNVSVDKQYVFAFMVNNFTSSSSDIKKQIEAYLLDLFQI